MGIYTSTLVEVRVTISTFEWVKITISIHFLRYGVTILTLFRREGECHFHLKRDGELTPPP